MPVSRRRKKGLDNLNALKNLRRAQKSGEQENILREMMEISKKFAKKEAGDEVVDASKYEVTVVDTTEPKTEEPAPE